MSVEAMFLMGSLILLAIKVYEIKKNGLTRGETHRWRTEMHDRVSTLEKETVGTKTLVKKLDKLIDSLNKEFDK